MSTLPADDAALLALAAPVDPPDPEVGLFAADAWVRRISSESVLLFGGGRALLLEVAHPLVAAGVAAHSNFRTDPFGRLQRTLAAMSAITFGSRDSALAAARSVERAHQRVRGNLSVAVGPFAAGAAYTGRDAELMYWVWATLVDTGRVVYEHFVAPLGPDALASFYRDQVVVARLLGIPAERLPATHTEFRADFEAIVAGDVLTVSDEARDIAAAVLSPTGGAPNAPVVGLITAALLPARLREAFGLPWDEGRAERFAALVDSVRRLRVRPAR